jgi:hypothetical protein
MVIDCGLNGAGGIERPGLEKNGGCIEKPLFV